jgi:hypothetical protein
VGKIGIPWFQFIKKGPSKLGAWIEAIDSRPRSPKHNCIQEELAEKLAASSISQDLSLRVLLHYLALKEEHLEICQKNCKELSINGATEVELSLSYVLVSKQLFYGLPLLFQHNCFTDL